MKKLDCIMVLFLLLSVEASILAASEIVGSGHEPENVAVGLAECVEAMVIQKSVAQRAIDLAQCLVGAVKKGDRAEVESLIEQGVSVDTQDQDGCAILLLSFESPNSKDMVRALLIAGADVQDRDNTSKPFLLCALQKEYELRQRGAGVPHAKKWGIRAIQLERCLSPGSADRAFREDQAMVSLVGKNNDAIRMLILAGADIYAEFSDEYGCKRTVLNYACDIGWGKKVLSATKERQEYEARGGELSGGLMEYASFPPELIDVVKKYAIDEEFIFLEERTRNLKKRARGEAEKKADYIKK